MGEVVDLAVHQRRRDFEALRARVKREEVDHTSAGILAMAIALQRPLNLQEDR